MRHFHQGRIKVGKPDEVEEEERLPFLRIALPLCVTSTPRPCMEEESRKLDTQHTIEGLASQSFSWEREAELAKIERRVLRCGQMIGLHFAGRDHAILFLCIHCEDAARTLLLHSTTVYTTTTARSSIITWKCSSGHGFLLPKLIRILWRTHSLLPRTMSFICAHRVC